MRGSVKVFVVLSLLACWSAACNAALGQTEVKVKPSIAVWDSGEQPAIPSFSALSGKNVWTALAAGTTSDAFRGDAILSNGRMVVLARKQQGALEVQGIGPNAVVTRVRLRLLTAAGEPAARLERIALTENTKTAATLEATFTTAKGTEASGKFRIKRGEVIVQVEPRAGASRLRVENESRFVVLPDFFADDITLDATRLPPLSAVDLPSENFVMNLTGGGDAITMCVFENRQQDVKVTLAETASQRIATGSEIGFEGKRIWVALLEAPRIWHTLDLTPADTGKIIPLGWKMPFPAQWRVDFTRAGDLPSRDLTDSWEMLLQEQRDGEYVKPSWLGSGDQRLPANRSRWNTVLGRYPYPCWSDPERNGYLEPLKSRVLQFAGPVLIYPINRVQQTPLDAFTVVDVMRNTLGVGPCEHILDLEGQKAECKGRATCGVRDKLTSIYAANQQVKLRDEVDKTLDEGLIFVKHIRGRITRYVEFGQKMRVYLMEQRKLRPELAEFIAEMDKLTQQIDTRVAARVAKIQTPEHVAKMNEEFRKNVLGYEGPDAIERCKAYTQALVVIGDNQDELSGECRWVVKTLRQRAGILLATDPRVATVAAEIRTRTQDALRNPADHEGARH
jgi:hypothetical protein